jgi:hypothetical protein
MVGSTKRSVRLIHLLHHVNTSKLRCLVHDAVNISERAGFTDRMNVQ